ncbi:hypothetical protein [Dyadobacter luticola]|uniref:Glycosyltransferase RgtA/B/C/D-like domain-containing protein n=1 Tax=Dyadobacter luticola TaxID=1979387 RepID=A0A5R9L313_9BACT|nr:hypothetical protein [Dyadobacter luticola]TLV02956.1 hypothetical protein FEN17_04910 [Dyadobacter luticola]
MLSRYSGNLLVLLTFLIVVVSRLYIVGSFAVPLPFWDQWDAEGDFLLKQWIEGRLKLTALWEPHNEHRIFPTRLLSLAVFNITHEWNNLTAARLNVFLAASVPAVLIWVLVKNRALSGARLFILPVLLAQFSLPFSFENLLIGFQSQFYFLMLFTLLALILATFRPDHIYAKFGIVTLCLLSILTMGSGLLTSVAVLSIYLLHTLNSQKLSKQNLILSAILIIIAVTGFLIIPKIPNYQIYRATNVSQLYNALGYILSWPVPDHQLPALLLWSPAFIVIPILLFKRKLKPSDILLSGCFVWSFSQNLAIAYGRGQEMTEVSSRYTELLSLGLVSNAWFAIRGIQEFRGNPLRWAFLAFFVTFLFGHYIRFSMDMHDMRRNYRYSLIQTTNVCNFLKTGNGTNLQKPGNEIPFPDSARLRDLLSQPTIRQMLPKSMCEFSKP